MIWNKIKILPTANFSLFNICGMLESRVTLEGVFMSIISDLFEKITGLHNGKYLTLSGKKKADTQGQSSWSLRTRVLPELRE